MRKKKILIKYITLFFSLLIVISTALQPTLAFVATKTQPIVNTFKPFKSIISDLIINKSVEHPFGAGYAIPANIKFDFEVNLGMDYAGKTLTTTNGDMTVDNNGTVVVTAKPGIPVEIQGLDEGTRAVVTEIQTASGFAVKDGVATKEAVITGDSAVSVDFVNVYTPAKVQDVNVNVTGIKKLQGRDWKQGDTFSFLLEQKTEGDNWTPIATKSVTYDSDNPDFDEFDFSDVIKNVEFGYAGTYEFRLSEIAGDVENVVYDKTVSHFNIIVGDKDMDGELEIQNVTASEKATVISDRYDIEVIFDNKYISPDIPKPEAINVPVSVLKTVTNTGDKSIGPENFEFVLHNVDTLEEQIQKTDENGLAEFILAFDADDIGKSFNYKLAETNTGIKGVTYSDKVYDIEISVMLGADNKLLATVRCDGVVVQNVVAEFENIYYVKSDVIKPTDPTKPTEPTKPTDPTKPNDVAPDNNAGPNNNNIDQGKDVLQTGDTRNIGLLFVIFSVSAVVWITLLLKGRSKGRAKN